MVADERTRDLYEQNAAYPKPPLVPLPEPGDLDSLEAMGLKPGKVSRRLVKTAMFLTGFTAFQKQLPQTIEGLLRQVNIRGPALFAPVIAATVALADDPRNVSPLERATTLLFAARSLYDDITAGRLAPDQYRGQALEMGQYPNLFSTSLILEGKRPRVFKSTNVSRLTVVVARRFYSLEIGDLGRETTVEQLKAALEMLTCRAHKNRSRADEPVPGILTCATGATQHKAFRRIQKSEVNRASLAMIRHSFLTLCLDLDDRPESYAQAALMAHSGNFGNRWYHSSLQLVVFGNARACIICNFDAYLDGNVMARAAAEMQQRAVACPLGNGARPDLVHLPPAAELSWQIGQDLMQQAQQDVRLILDNQPATFEIQGIGRRHFAAHNVEPVPVFMLALQMAAKCLTGKMARITQFLAMSKYRCMDLATAVVTTPEVGRFVDYMDSGELERDRAIVLLREAIDAQVRACRRERRQLPLDNILSLFVLSRQGLRQWYVLLLTALTAVLLRLMGLWRPEQREVLVSHPATYPEIPIIGRPGIRIPYVKYFGLPYQLFEDRIVITMMPSVSWTIPNAEFVAVLRECLQRIQGIICSGS